MDEQQRNFIAYIYIYVDTSIIGECERPCRLEKVCVIKRSST